MSLYCSFSGLPQKIARRFPCTIPATGCNIQASGSLLLTEALSSQEHREMRSDSELVSAVLAGEREAFADLVRRYEAPVRAAALAVVADPLLESGSHIRNVVPTPISESSSIRPPSRLQRSPGRAAAS